MDKTVVVVGNFDGVHPGHQAVLAEAHRRQPSLPLVVVTFWPHPVSVLHPGAPPMLLTSLEGRIELLQEYGADRVEVVRFTRDFAAKSPQEFVDEYLIPLNPALVVVGKNFRFGHGAAGSVRTLEELSQGRFEVEGLALVGFADEETCSTRIREALQRGDVAHAAKHLGRSFRFRGVVAHGDQRGRTLGFPTANLPVPELRACPADGVYAGWVWRLDEKDAFGVPLPDAAAAEHWPAAISVGSNPTFDGLQRRVESYILDRDDLQLYDAPIMVEFVERIRGQVRFNGVDELVAQLRSDVAGTKKILGAADR
jgi:riboflavin kinase/FMN adenylyltransferase